MNKSIETMTPEEISAHTDPQIRVLRDFLAVRKIDLKTKDTGLIQVVRLDDRLMFGIVCQVGSGVLTANGQLHQIEVKVGETVVFDRSNATIITARSGEQWLIINELSIRAVLP